MCQITICESKVHKFVFSGLDNVTDWSWASKWIELLQFPGLL
ncbi:hypothetical protein HanPI659440_Chr03g0117851 [Helianthus annuus]|nr:hypothetical protein HanPI659440_Chr03g0117851 [Helianthus annuus]